MVQLKDIFCLILEDNVMEFQFLMVQLKATAFSTSKQIR